MTEASGATPAMQERMHERMHERLHASVDASLAQPSSVRQAVTMGGADGTRGAWWGIAVEAPIEVALNGVPWTVLLGTPHNVADLAVGVALTERVLRDASRITDVCVSEYLHDVSVNLVAPDSAFDLTRQRSRSLVSSTACGLCGLESLAELASQMGTGALLEVRGDVADAAIRIAFGALASQQPLNRETRSVHAAAWCSTRGEILLVREDVGRHNALDKLVGALATRGALASDGFIAMTSRCSYELVYKAAQTGARLLATISAPTSMALAWSRELALPIACVAGADVVRFPLERDDAR